MDQPSSEAAPAAEQQGSSSQVKEGKQTQFQQIAVIAAEEVLPATAVAMGPLLHGADLALNLQPDDTQVS